MSSTPKLEDYDESPVYIAFPTAWLAPLKQGCHQVSLQSPVLLLVEIKSNQLLPEQLLLLFPVVYTQSLLHTQFRLSHPFFQAAL